MWCEWWKLNIDIKWKLFTDNGHEQPGEIHFLRVKSVILTKPPVLSCHPPNVYFSPQTACRRNNWSQVRSGFGWTPVLLDVLLQLLAGGVSGNLDQMSIGSREVRVSSVRKYQWDKSGNSNKKNLLKTGFDQKFILELPVCHRPVEEAVHFVDVHVEVLGGLYDKVDISLARSPLWPVTFWSVINTCVCYFRDNVKSFCRYFGLRCLTYEMSLV